MGTFRERVEDFAHSWEKKIGSVDMTGISNNPTLEANIDNVKQTLETEMIDSRLEQGLCYYMGPFDAPAQITVENNEVTVRLEKEVPDGDVGARFVEIKIEIDGDNTFFKSVEREGYGFVGMDYVKESIFETFDNGSINGIDRIREDIEGDSKKHYHIEITGDSYRHTEHTESASSDSFEEGKGHIKISDYELFSSEGHEHSISTETADGNVVKQIEINIEDNIGHKDGFEINSHNGYTTKIEYDYSFYVKTDLAFEGEKTRIDTDADGKINEKIEIYLQEDNKVFHECFDNEHRTEIACYDADTRICIEKTDFDYDVEKETYKCETFAHIAIDSYGLTSVSEDIRDKDGNIIEVLREGFDATTYDLVVIPEQFSGDDIDKRALYNLESSDHNVTSLYGYEFYRDDKLVGVMVYCEGNEGNPEWKGFFEEKDFSWNRGQISFITVADFETQSVDRFYVTMDIKGDTPIINHMDIPEVLNVEYDKESHSLMITEKIFNFDGSEFESDFARVERYEMRVDSTLPVLREELTSLSETKEDIMERISAKGIDFDEKCVKTGSDPIEKLQEIEVKGCEMKPIGAFWASVGNTENNEISYWTQFSKVDLSHSFENSYVTTFTISPDARVCLCNTAEDTQKLAILYPIENLRGETNEIIHSATSDWATKVDWSALAKDFDVLIVDTRDSGEVVKPHDIEVSIAVFNEEIIENLESKPVVEYLEEVGIKDYEFYIDYDYGDYDEGYGEYYDEYYDEDDGVIYDYDSDAIEGGDGEDENDTISDVSNDDADYEDSDEE